MARDHSIQSQHGEIFETNAKSDDVGGKRGENIEVEERRRLGSLPNLFVTCHYIASIFVKESKKPGRKYNIGDEKDIDRVVEAHNHDKTV